MVDLSMGFGDFQFRLMVCYHVLGSAFPMYDVQGVIPTLAHFLHPPSTTTTTKRISGPEVICTWSGQLPARRHKNPTFSPRVFLGGVPWDVTEAALLASFQPFGSLNIDWPGKDSKHNRHPPKGIVVFINSQPVKGWSCGCL